MQVVQPDLGRDEQVLSLLSLDCLGHERLGVVRLRRIDEVHASVETRPKRAHLLRGSAHPSVLGQADPPHVVVGAHAYLRDEGPALGERFQSHRHGSFFAMIASWLALWLGLPPSRYFSKASASRGATAQVPYLIGSTIARPASV